MKARRIQAREETMRRTAMFAFAIGMVIGCTNPEPSLTGSFGGDDALLQANSNHASFIFGCRQVVLDPIVLQPDGHITASGMSISPDQVWRTGDGVPTTLDVHQVTMDLLDVTAHVQGQPDQHYQLRRDAPPIFRAVCAYTAAPQAP